MKTRRILILLVQIFVVLAVVVYGGARYLTSMPDVSYEGMLPPIAPDEMELAQRLRAHVEAISSKEHNLDHHDELESVARYIEATLAKHGLATKPQAFSVDGKTVRNIEVTIEGRSPSPPSEAVIVGAHYDTAPGSPGANSNGSGTAALLELAPRLAALKGQSAKQIRLVFFANGEPPHLKTSAMGSFRYAQDLATRKEPVAAMLSLDSVGYYSNEPHSQRHAFIMNFLLPSRGDFIAFLARHSSYALLREAVRAFRLTTKFPSIGVAGPSFHPGVNASDHWAFAEHGYPALVITDTGHYRYPHHRQATDTPDKLDYERLARVVKGVDQVIRAIAK